MHIGRCLARSLLALAFAGTVWIGSLRASAQTTQPAGETKIVPAIVDLDIGEPQALRLCNGRSVTVKLVEVKVTRDPVRSAVRRAEVQIEIDGAKVELVCGTYRLPITVGDVQVDCPATLDYTENATSNFWAMAKRARLRLWPAGGPLLDPGTFRYPVRQRWFATDTQMGNDPCYVGGEVFKKGKIYYHSGLDFGGCEGLIDLVAAVDGVVVSVGDKVLPEHKREPVAPRYDRVHILDGRGWYVRYSHVKDIDPSIRLGQRIRMGDRIGVLGKEGTSGGWSHLHFEIFSLMPSGKYGSQEAYAFAWEAWLREAKPAVVAVARPHGLARVGDPVTLDGSRSWCAAGASAGYEWTLTDGRQVAGAKVETRYERPGYYSEILKVTDAAGHAAYDFAVVHVVDTARASETTLGVHAAYAPTQGIRAGQTVTFKARTFGTTDGEESWDFGDGSPKATTRSDGNVKQLDPNGYAVLTHAFDKSGNYIVTVTRANAQGVKAMTRLWVTVE